QPVGNPQPVATQPQTPAPQQPPSQLGMARANFLTEAQRRGLDANQYSSGFDSYLDQILGAAGSGANLDSLFSPNIGADYLSGLQASQRNQYAQSVNSTFNPNYASSTISSDILNPTIDEILS